MKLLSLAIIFFVALSAPAHASIVCDGTNFLSASSNAAYNSLTAWSMSLWVKKATDGTLQGIAGTSGPTGYAMQILATNVIRGRDGAGNTLLDSTDTVIGTAWHHVVLTFNGATGAWVIYYDDDGSPASGTSGAVTQLQSTVEICRNGSTLAETSANGTKIALVTMWNSVLTSGNVTSLKATCTPEGVATASNIASWKLTNGSLTDSSATANNQVNANSLAGSTDEPTPCAGAAAETFGFYKRRGL